MNVPDTDKRSSLLLDSKAYQSKKIYRTSPCQRGQDYLTIKWFFELKYGKDGNKHIILISFIYGNYSIIVTISNFFRKSTNKRDLSTT
jgi:hypothetical protein